tara:strand:- start:5019 stop:5594 length:576 start_codon:yes stop_codon:yes gene_type:complete
MRKILGKKDNSKQNQLILGIGLILLMLFSVLGYALGGRSSNEEGKNIEYNGIEFIQDSSGYWRFIIDNSEFLTQYNPEEVLNIDFNGNIILSDFQDKPLYFVGDSQEPIIEIVRNLERFVLRIQNACINKEDCKEDFPIKDCFEDNIIIIKELDKDNAENIYQQGNCVFIKASFANQTKYADKFIYSLLGV